MKIHPRSSVLNRRSTAHGFTLIELLVAMAITTIIITILVSITSLSLDTWNRSRAEIRAARQGKSMIDSMARDLESLVVRKGNSFEWLYAKSNPSSDGPKGNASPNAVDLIFFSAATDRYDGKIGTADDKGGDVSTIGYKLVYKDPIAGDTEDKYKTFVLYRKIVNPDDTFKDLLGQTDLEAKFSTFTGTGANSVDDERNFICENVYQFTLIFHVEVTVPATGGPGSANTVDVPIVVDTNGSGDRNFKITGTGINTSFSVPSALASKISADQLKTGRVSAVEISLTVLTDFALNRMQKVDFKAAGGKSKDDMKAEFIAKNSYEYSKLIPVPGS